MERILFLAIFLVLSSSTFATKCAKCKDCLAGEESILIAEKDAIECTPMEICGTKVYINTDLRDAGCFPKGDFHETDDIANCQVYDDANSYAFVLCTCDASENCNSKYLSQPPPSLETITAEFRTKALNRKKRSPNLSFYASRG
uniref:Sodefrin-like factor n=1 Tax=Acrobeloides nanus TaxID=290746 RepID=A0A914E9H3_9BILA